MRATKAEREHMGEVAKLPCLICGRWPVEVHHVVGYADRIGRAPKRHDRVVPLCGDHHRAVHELSHKGMYRVWEIDLMAQAERLANG